MKVIVFTKRAIKRFMIAYPATKASLEMWLSHMEFADWDVPQDILNTYKNADILGNINGVNSSRVVFNIAGNNYRMICRYKFRKTRVWLYIKWIGTHAEYDKLCKLGNQYTVSDY